MDTGTSPPLTAINEQDQRETPNTAVVKTHTITPTTLSHVQITLLVLKATVMCPHNIVNGKALSQRSAMDETQRKCQQP